MKLTADQIGLIDAFLVKKGVKYCDVKLELIDHIASEIESKIDNDGTSFNEALVDVMKKWQFQFEIKSSFLIGIVYSFPKIVLDTLIRRVRFFVIFSFLFAFFVVGIHNYFNSAILRIISPFIEIVNLTTIATSGFILVFLFLINFKSSPTSFRFLVNQTTPVIFICVFILFLSHEEAGLKLYFLLILIFNSVYVFKNFNYHKIFIKKHLTLIDGIMNK